MSALTSTQSSVISSLIEMFPEINSSGTIARKQIVEFLAKTGSKWPTFITNQKAIARGVYPIPGSTVIINTPVIDNSSIVNNMIEKTESSTKQIAISSSEKKAAKRKALIEKGQAMSGQIKGGANEPTISPLSYKLDLIKALNYYNLTYDSKDKAKWTREYVTDKATRALLSKLSDYEFNSVGALIRLKNRGCYLEDTELNRIDTMIDELIDRVKSLESVSSQVESTSKKVVINTPVIDKNYQESLSIAGEFEGLIDEFIKNGVEPDFAQYLKSINATPTVVKRIPEMFQSQVKELTEVLLWEDPDLREGYSNLGKVKTKKLLKIYENLIEACDNQKKIARITVNRKPRAKKIIPPSKLVSKMKYLKEDETLGIKSELPTKLIGATEVWLYNTKYRKLMIYKTAEPSKISVKGSSLIGWDPTSSKCKSIRKPMDIIPRIALTTGKRDLARMFKELTTTESDVNGRLNENTIILKIFS